MKRLLTVILIFSFTVFGTKAFGQSQNGAPIWTEDEVQFDNSPLKPEYERAKQVYTYLAWATYLQATERLSDAKKAYGRVLAGHSESAFVQAQLAELSLKMQDIRTAEQACRRAIEINPERPASHFLLGKILIRRVRQNPEALEGAIAEFQKVVELDPNHVQAHSRLGNIAIQRREYELAVHSFKELTRIVPYQPQFHLTLGNLYDALGNEEEAVAAYERTLRINRDIFQAHEALGKLYVERYERLHGEIYSREVEPDPELVQNAEASLEKAVHSYVEMRRLARPRDRADFDPIIRDSRARLGSLYLSFGKSEKAVAVFQEVLAEEPNHADAHFGIALAYQEQDNFEKAEYHFKKTIQLDAARKQSYDSLGYLYLMQKKPEKAVEVWGKLLETDPNDAEVNYWIGMAYQEAGNFQKSEYHLRKAIQLAPEHKDAHNALGYLFAEHNTNLNEAAELVKKALQKSPQNGAYLDSLGWVYYKQGKFDAAVAELEKAVRYLPDSPEIQDHLGDVYLKKGLKQKAIAIWQKAVQLDPENRQLQEKLKRQLELTIQE